LLAAFSDKPVCQVNSAAAAGEIRRIPNQRVCHRSRYARSSPGKKKEKRKRREGLNVKPRCKRLMKKQTKGWQEEIKRPATET
jgi:hypothetical protein